MQFLADNKLSEENAESPHEGSDGVSCSRGHNSLLICGHGVAVRVWSSLFSSELVAAPVPKEREREDEARNPIEMFSGGGGVDCWVGESRGPLRCNRQVAQ